MVLVWGIGLVIGLLLFYKELEARSAASSSAASAQAYADTTLYAELGQQSEPTNVPTGGSLPLTEIPQGGFNDALPAQTNLLILANMQKVDQ